MVGVNDSQEAATFKVMSPFLKGRDNFALAMEHNPQVVTEFQLFPVEWSLKRS